MIASIDSHPVKLPCAAYLIWPPPTVTDIAHTCSPHHLLLLKTWIPSDGRWTRNLTTVDLLYLLDQSKSVSLGSTSHMWSKLKDVWYKRLHIRPGVNSLIAEVSTLKPQTEGGSNETLWLPASSQAHRRRSRTSSNSLVVGNLNVPPDWGWDKKSVPWLSYYWFWYCRNYLFLKVCVLFSSQTQIFNVIRVFKLPFKEIYVRCNGVLPVKIVFFKVYLCLKT